MFRRLALVLIFGFLLFMAVTTAENAHGALELLGLADGQQNFSNTVSGSYFYSAFCSCRKSYQFMWDLINLCNDLFAGFRR